MIKECDNQFQEVLNILIFYTNSIKLLRSFVIMTNNNFTAINLCKEKITFSRISELKIILI